MVFGPWTWVSVCVSISLSLAVGSLWIFAGILGWILTMDLPDDNVLAMASGSGSCGWWLAKILCATSAYTPRNL